VSTTGVVHNDAGCPGTDLVPACVGPLALLFLEAGDQGGLLSSTGAIAAERPPCSSRGANQYSCRQRRDQKEGGVRVFPLPPGTLAGFAGHWPQAVRWAAPSCFVLADYSEALMGLQPSATEGLAMTRAP